MKMAVASKADVERMVRFFQFIEQFMEYGTDMLDDSDGDDYPKPLTDEEFVERLRVMWGHRFGPALVDAAWARVVFGYKVMFDNCCDKENDVLELRADWKAILEQHEARQKGGAA